MPDRPNLLFILTDQQRWDTMGCYGNDWIQTPALDRLASGSFVFENAYVTQPVCTPSRTSILTGLYPQTSGATTNNIPLGPDARTIAEMVPDGVTCGYYGKWHLGDEILAQHGFTEWVSSEDQYREHYSRPETLSRMSDYHHYLVARGVEPDKEYLGQRVFSRQLAAELPAELSKAAFLGREAARFIRDIADEPFVLFVSFLEPHPPYTSPLAHLYPPDEIPGGPTFLKRPPENASLFHRLRADYYMGLERVEFDLESGLQVENFDLRTEAGWRELASHYYGNVTLVDRAVGVILDALDASGQADQTAVVFTSEHGEMLGDHGLLEKRTLYQESVKVPLLMRVPWVSDSQRSVPGHVSLIDLAPTLLDLMGDPVPAHLDGESRLPVLTGQDTLDDNDVFVQWNGRGDRELGSSEIDRAVSAAWRSMVSADGWKLNLCASDQCELYDLNTDPHEQINLFGEPAQRVRLRDMAASIRGWMESLGDTAPLPGV